MSAGFARADELKDLTAYDSEGNKIGAVQQVYLDDATGRPDWVTVKTGLFGSKASFVPLAGARSDGQSLQLAHPKSVVKDAPRVDADEHLELEQEHDLYQYYGLTDEHQLRDPAGAVGPARPGGVAGSGRPDGGAMGSGRPDGAGGREAERDDHVKEFVRSEERLRVGKTEDETGRARLRKVVVTEEVTTTVPVSHEEVRVVREPIAEGERVGGAGEIGEDEMEVVLHAERPVVSTETVPVERVHLETERVTENQEVSGTVRKERVDFESDDAEADRRTERG